MSSAHHTISVAECRKEWQVELRRWRWKKMRLQIWGDHIDYKQDLLAQWRINEASNDGSSKKFMCGWSSGPNYSPSAAGLPQIYFPVQAFKGTRLDYNAEFEVESFLQT
jgi:hypothetical protein